MDGRRRALIVANGEYDNEGLSHLRSPAADAAALADVLGDPDIGRFDVVVVQDEPAHAVQGHIEELFSESKADDLLLLHLSCHGLKSDSGELFFAMRNTRPDRLASSAVPADFVQRCIRGSRARSVVLLLDCCYGGAYGRGVAVRASGEAKILDNFPQQLLGSGRGRAVITASSAIEYAFEGDRLADEQALEPSVFTSALVRGLRTGEADRDEDGQVSLNELYDYVFDRVREKNPHQTPSRDIEMQGELYLARSQRRRVKAAPMPPDLEAAIHDANMYSRIGAIGELRARLLSENLPAAAGAHEALVEMAGTDIGHVAELAEAAAREAAVHTDIESVHLPAVPTGAPSPHATVRLLGPPLARVCTPVVSDDWLRVSTTGAEVDMYVDTRRPGLLHGTLTLKGTTGEVVVAVDAEVSGVPQQRGADAAAGEAGPAEPSATGASHGDTAVPSSSAPGLPQPGSDPPPMSATATSGPARGDVPAWSILWAGIPIVSIGFLAPLPFFHAAIRLRSPRLATAGVAYLAAVVTFVAMSRDYDTRTASGFVTVVVAVVASAHALLLRRKVFARGQAAAPDRPTGPGSRWSATRVPSREALEPDAPQVPTLRLVVLGVAGSGKTVFLSSMFHTLHVPMPEHAYFLETSAAHRVYLSRVFDEVSDTREPWPRGTRTGESRELVFDCVAFRGGVKHRMFRISYLDYAGEILEAEPEAGETALRTLEEHIASAHGLLGMLDGFRVLQYLRNEPEGRRYFRSSLQPLIGMMAGATCPIHFALTKWDLLRGFGEPLDADDATRLALVSAALMNSDQMRALVDAHSFGNRVVRLIPVSAVGPDFATIDDSGHVVKRRDGRLRPTNVEIPFAAVLPDLFDHVRSLLDPRLEGAVTKAARNRAGLAPNDADRALAAFRTHPAGVRLRHLLDQVLGSGGDSLAGMFLDWHALPLEGSPAPRDALTLGAAQGRAVADFWASLARIEADLPASRLSTGR
jgi:uncharacterized caspase-like protein